MDEKRLVLNDRVWERIAPFLPGMATDSGQTGGDNRRFLEALFWRIRTGPPWRDGVDAARPAGLLETQLANDLDIHDAAQIQRFPPPQVCKETAEGHQLAGVQ